MEQLIAAGVGPDMILYQGMIPAMNEVGRLFEQGEVFVPEMLVSAHAMKGGMELLQPLLENTDVKPIAKVVMGTVQGDVHDIGKNLAIMMLKGAGFEVIDLGVNVPPAQVCGGGGGWRGRGRHVGAADHHHAQHEGDHRPLRRRRDPGAGQDHRRRRAGDPGVCRTRSGPTAMVPTPTRRSR